MYHVDPHRVSPYSTYLHDLSVSTSNVDRNFSHISSATFSTIAERFSQAGSTVIYGAAKCFLYVSSAAIIGVGRYVSKINKKKCNFTQKSDNATIYIGHKKGNQNKLRILESLR